MFLWLTYEPDTSESYFPEKDAIIQSLKYSVRGRENLFVKQLNAEDLERFTRQNTHDLCDFRTLFEDGQGVLLHLRDIGLTEEVSFGKRDRIQLSVQLLKSKDPKTTVNTIDFVVTGTKVFKVCLIRTNQLFRGNSTASKFEFFNEA